LNSRKLTTAIARGDIARLYECIKVRLVFLYHLQVFGC
jgi:hypothetical protein